MRKAEAESLLSFVKTPVFVEQLAELAGKAEMELLYAIQNDLLLDPQRGDLIKAWAAFGRPGSPTRKRRRAKAVASVIYTSTSHSADEFICFISTANVNSRISAIFKGSRFPR